MSAARFHDSVSLSPAVWNDPIIDRAGVGGERQCVGCGTLHLKRTAAKPASQSTRRAWRRGGQHVLCATHASSRAKTAAVEALVEMGGRGGSGSAVCVVADRTRRGPWNDCANLPAVVQAASEQTRIGLVLADAEFDSERNHSYIRKQLGARSVIPAKRGKKTQRIHGVRAEMRRAFPQQLYRPRSLIESLFSSVKRKLSARAPGRSLHTAEASSSCCSGLSFNLYRPEHRWPFLRMSTEPVYSGTPDCPGAPPLRVLQG